MSGSDGPHATIHLAPRMITRAAVLERIGAPLLVTELELDAPGAGEVLVELHASGVCHSDLNAIDGTAATPCPAVLGHEGGGVVRQLGRGVSRVAVGDHVALSWAPSCGHCAECLDDLPHLCGTAWPMMARGTLLDGTTWRPNACTAAAFSSSGRRRAAPAA